MANYYVSSAGWLAVTQWAASAAVSLGAYRRQLATPTFGNERVFKCTTAGTTGGTEPSWNLSDGATTNDGTVVWTQVAGRESEQLAGNWRAPLANFNTLTSIDGRDTVFISHDHAQSTTGANLTISGNDASYLCVNRSTGSMPPVEADLTTGATVSVLGNVNLTHANRGFWRGVKFIVGSGANAVEMRWTAATWQAELCEFELASTSGSARFYFGKGTTERGLYEIINCGLRFGATGQGVYAEFSELIWRDTPSNALLGTFSTSDIFKMENNNGARSKFTIKNVDLSGMTAGLATLMNWLEIDIINCKLAAGVPMPSSYSGNMGQKNGFRLHNSDDATAGRNYRFFEKNLYGQLESDTVVTRDSGASDGVTQYSMLCKTANSTQGQSQGIVIPPIQKRVNALVSKTFTVELLFVGALPAKNKAALWLEYLNSSGAPIGTTARSASSPLDSATIDASTEAWGANAPLRANSTSYSSGAAPVFKVASNPGRLFIVTGSGTSAGSEPAAYATAVDGDTFTDGSCTIVCLSRGKLSVTVTPAKAGFVRAELRIRPLTQITFWVDPKLTVS